MSRSFMLAIIAMVMAGSARSATVDCRFEGAEGHLVFSYAPEEGDANSAATVREGVRVSSVLVQAGPGIVSFLDIPDDGRIMITTVALQGGKAVFSSHGSRDGALVADQRAGHCEQSQ